MDKGIQRAPLVPLEGLPPFQDTTVQTPPKTRLDGNVSLQTMW
jgi:hypothetical protein